MAPWTQDSGKVGTALRILRERRWGDLRSKLERDTFPKSVFYTRRLVFCRMTEVRRPLRPLDFIEVREAGPEDEPLLRQVRDHRDGFAHMFERGDLCYLALAKGTPAAFLWAVPGELHVSKPNGYTFWMGPGGGWTYAVEVHPAFRLKGAFGKLWSDAFDALRARGFERLYTSMPEDENAVSLRSHAQLGFEIFLRYKVTRTLGRLRWRTESVDGVSREGRGTWQGEDPLHPRR